MISTRCVRAFDTSNEDIKNLIQVKSRHEHVARKDSMYTVK